MTIFGAGPATPQPASSVEQITQAQSLFNSDYQYAKTALTQINQPDMVCQWTAHDKQQIIALTAPHDLQERLRQLPREAVAADDHYSLCADPARMAEAIETARQAKAEDATWPALHYLWPQHPVMDWLGDRVMTSFGRHRAPALQSARLRPGEQAFILMSLVPNRKGLPLLVQWQAACRVGNAGPFLLEPFDAFAQRTGLRAGGLRNPGQTPQLAAAMQTLQAALPQAVAAMHARMTSSASGRGAGPSTHRWPRMRWRACSSSAARCRNCGANTPPPWCATAPAPKTRWTCGRTAAARSPTHRPM